MWESLRIHRLDIPLPIMTGFGYTSSCSTKPGLSSHNQELYISILMIYPGITKEEGDCKHEVCCDISIT